MLHVTCDAHFQTFPSYSSQKSYMKIWFWLVEPFKSYCVHRQKKKKIIDFLGGRNPLLGGGLHLTFDAHFRTRMSYSSQKSCENLVWIGWNRRYVKFQGGGRSPLLGRGHMWAAMPIFVHGWAISVKSLMWKFSSYWLSLSRVIVSTDKKKKKLYF